MLNEGQDAKSLMDVLTTSEACMENLHKVCTCFPLEA